MAEHPQVNDICVYGIKAASGAPGESDLVAAIVPTDDTEPDIQNIFDFCVRGLERNSVPSFIQIVEEIPKTISEKNLGRLLNDSFDQNAPNVFPFNVHQK